MPAPPRRTRPSPTSYQDAIETIEQVQAAILAILAFPRLSMPVRLALTALLAEHVIPSLRNAR